MTTQSITLTLEGEGWQGAVLINSAFVQGGGTAYLRHIQDVSGSIQVYLAATADGELTGGGPHFTAAFEQAEGAFTFVADESATLVLKGPGHADNTVADSDEPYFWTPDNGAEMQAWFNTHRHHEVTLTLDDGVDPATVVRGKASAGEAETAAGVTLLPAPTLADFDADGLELDALALIRAGAGPNNTLFATPPRGTVGALLDGELGLGADEAAITRIRRRNGNMLLINDNAPLSLRDYFSPGGAGADLTLYLQTRDGVASLPVSAHGSDGRNYIQFGPVGAALDAILDGIDEGDRFIFAFARPAPSMVAVHGAAEAAGAETTLRLLRVSPEVNMIRGNLAAARTAVVASIQRIGPLDDRYQRTLRESAPADRLLTALEIAHPAIAQPVRVINDTVGRRIEGSDYVALRFDARLVDDIAGQAPQAELAIDNVGRALTQWIEATGGGVGATVRVMLVLDIPDPPVEWEVTLDVAGMTIDQERVTARLGFDPLLGGNAVTLRHDPETSPGLF